MERVIMMFSRKMKIKQKAAKNEREKKDTENLRV